MFYGDHSPPHFHALYQGEEVQVNIETLAVIAGKMPRRALGLVVEWVRCIATSCAAPGPPPAGIRNLTKLHRWIKVCRMIRIIEAKPLEGYRLQIRFNDGLEGIYAIEPERRGGVFLALRDPTVFNAVRVNSDFGCVEWPGGVDLCPTAMREEMTVPANSFTS